MDFITNIFFQFFGKFADGSLEMFVEMINKLQSKGVVIIGLPIVQSLITYLQSLLISIFIVKVMYEIIMIYFLRKNGDKTLVVSDWVFRMAYGVFLIVFLPYITIQMWNFGMDLAKDVNTFSINTSAAANQFITEQKSTITGLISQLSFGGIYNVLMIVGLVVLMLIVLFQSYTRSIELVVYLIIGMFSALGLTVNSEIMTPWYKKIWALSLSQAMVVFLVKMMFAVLAFTQSSASMNGLDRLLIGLACLWTIVFAPSAIEQFMGHAGAHKSIDTAAKFKDNINKLMKWKK